MYVCVALDDNSILWSTYVWHIYDKHHHQFWLLVWFGVTFLLFLAACLVSIRPNTCIYRIEFCVDIIEMRTSRFARPKTNCAAHHFYVPNSSQIIICVFFTVEYRTILEVLQSKRRLNNTDKVIFLKFSIVVLNKIEPMYLQLLLFQHEFS